MTGLFGGYFFALCDRRGKTYTEDCRYFRSRPEDLRKRSSLTGVAKKDPLQKKFSKAHILRLTAPIAKHDNHWFVCLFGKPHQVWFPWRRPELWLTFVSGLLPTLLPFLQDDEPVRNKLLRIPTSCRK